MRSAPSFEKFSPCLKRFHRVRRTIILIDEVIYVRGFLDDSRKSLHIDVTVPISSNVPLVVISFI